MTTDLDEANKRIAQLEEALKMMLEAGESEYREDWVAATRNGNFMLSGSSSTWLSEHDKEVAAKERERCIAKCEYVSGIYLNKDMKVSDIALLVASTDDCIAAIRELK